MAKPYQGTVYIAGPMRGIRDNNWPAFDDAAARFRNKGWKVYNPAQMDRDDGWTPVSELDGHGCPSRTKRSVLKRDLRVIIDDCTAIAMLPGWSKSDGARAEVAVAEFLGLDMLDAMTMKPLEPRKVEVQGIKDDLREKMNSMGGENTATFPHMLHEFYGQATPKTNMGLIPVRGWLRVEGAP